MTRDQPAPNGPEKRAMKARLVYIDCLRGLAAAWVVAYHAWGGAFATPTTQQAPAIIPASPSLPFLLGFGTIQYGYVGVQLFFVLSGFCIHLPQARSPPRPLAVGIFLRRRFVRLYPAYLASIVFAMAAAGLPNTIADVLGSQTSGDWMRTFRVREAVVNAAFLQLAWPKALELNSVYWTLLYEAQFYLLYPAILKAARRGFRGCSGGTARRGSGSSRSAPSPL